MSNNYIENKVITLKREEGSWKAEKMWRANKLVMVSKNKENQGRHKALKILHFLGPILSLDISNHQQEQKYGNLH